MNYKRNSPMVLKMKKKMLLQKDLQQLKKFQLRKSAVFNLLNTYHWKEQK